MTWHVVCRARDCYYEHRVNAVDRADEGDLAAELAHGHHAATGHRVAWGRIDADAPRSMPAEIDAEIAPDGGQNYRERILDLLQDADGRIEQAEVHDATGWPASRVSRVVDEMDADDEVVKIPIGVSNLLCLPDAVPEAIADTPIVTDGGTATDPSRLMECPRCGSHSALRRGVEDCPHCGTSCVRARADGGQCDAAVACVGCGERVERRSTDHYCETDGCEYNVEEHDALDTSEYRVTTPEKLGDPEAIQGRGRAQEEG